MLEGLEQSNRQSYYHRVTFPIISFKSSPIGLIVALLAILGQTKQTVELYPRVTIPIISFSHQQQATGHFRSLVVVVRKDYVVSVAFFKTAYAFHSGLLHR